MVAAIEIYNKPDFEYRVETFSVLAVNAWELLLKARILQLDSNKLDAIIEYEHRTNVDGTQSKKRYKKTNRAGNHVSIGLFKAFDRLKNKYGDSMPDTLRKNLEAITEVRDNAIHFVNCEAQLELEIQKLGTAAVVNYVNATRQWFGVDLSRYNFFLMPLAFFRDFHTAQGVSFNTHEQQLLDYFSDLQSDGDGDDSSDFQLAIEIDVSIKRAGNSSLQPVRITNDPNALAITLDEEDIREKYPWTYAILTKRLENKYSDFKQNGDYHAIRKPLESDQRFCTERLLDPGNPSSTMKRFYNPNIVQQFDQHYTKK